MKVQKLTCVGYRNLQEIEWSPCDGVNILYGDNAQGKTNLLEAVWLFTGGRSFRGARDADLVGFGKEKALLHMAFYAQDRAQEADMTIQKRRSVVLNGVTQPSPSHLTGRFCAVVFSPAHLSLIKDGPEERRRFLDAAYCQLRPGYIAVLAEYTRTLAQRNALLKDTRGGVLARSYCDEMLDIWDQKLAQAGARVMMARESYVKKIGPLAAAIYDGLSGGKERFSIGLGEAGGISAEVSSGNAASWLYERLKTARPADMAAGFTTVGPHRTDLDVRIDGSSARTFGSQGQQRSAVLALKLAEASILREVTGEQPVALLDDVMSELDVWRQDYVLNHIHDWQVFITCCDPAAIRRLDGGCVFHMKDGGITRETAE